MALSADDAAPQRLNFNKIKGRRVDHVDVSEGASFLFWGLVSSGQPSPQAVLGHYVDNEHRVSNLSIHTEQTFGDGLISLLTLGIYSPWSIRYEGDVVHVRPVSASASVEVKPASSTKEDSDDDE